MLYPLSYGRGLSPNRLSLPDERLKRLRDPYVFFVAPLIRLQFFAFDRVDSRPGDLGSGVEAPRLEATNSFPHTRQGPGGGFGAGWYVLPFNTYCCPASVAQIRQ